MPVGVASRSVTFLLRPTLSLVLLALMFTLAGGGYWWSQVPSSSEAEADDTSTGNAHHVTPRQVRQGAAFDAAEEELRTQRKQIAHDAGLNAAASLEEDEDADMLTVRVVDDRGEPLADAMIFIDAMEGPSDADGNLEVYLPQEDLIFWVGAAGYEVVQCARPERFDEVFEVEMALAVRLDIRWTVPIGTDMNLLSLMVRSEGPLFPRRDPHQAEIWRRFRDEFGMNAMGMSIEGWGQDVQGEWRLFPRQEDISLWGLTPEVPMEVLLVDSLRDPVARSGTQTFNAGEHRSLELEMSFPQKELIGTVRDQGGAPLGDAEVTLYGKIGGPFGISLRTGKDGEFQFEGIVSREVNLEVRCTGFASRYLRRLPVTDGEHRDVLMERSRDVLVRFREPKGKIHGGGQVWKLGPVGTENQTTPEGTLMKNMPQQTFDVTWTIGGFVGRDSVPAFVQEHILEVPAMGALHVDLMRRDGSEGKAYRLACRPMHSNAWGQSIYRFFHFRKSTREQAVEVAPLYPGTYTCHAYEHGLNEEGTWSWQLVGSSAAVEVVAGRMETVMVRVP